jgi:MYXO-CTERM domain-containing protein
MKKITGFRRTVSAPLGLAAATAFTSFFLSSNAGAITAWSSDCNFGFQNSYNPGDGVCVTGELDVVPPGHICGEGYVIVAVANTMTPFVDVTQGGANYILGCSGAGAFYDEYVWLPPLKPGSYELVIDQYPFFGSFGPEDWRTGGVEFTVSNAPIVFSVDVAAIKAAAEDGLHYAESLEDLAHYLHLLDEVSEAAEWAEAFESIWGGVARLALGFFCHQAHVDCPTSYNGAIITIGVHIIEGVSESLSLHYASLIADPPNPNFDDVVGLDLADAQTIGAPWTPGASNEIVERTVTSGQLLALQVSAYDALLPTIEKLQGAQLAGSNTGMMIQAEKTIAYAELAIAAGDQMVSELDALEGALGGSANGGPDPMEIQAAIDTLASQGFSAEEDAFLRSFGLNDADIAAAKDGLAALPVPPAMKPADLVADARQTFQAMRGALVDLSAQAEQVRAENEPYALRVGPDAAINAPPTGGVGVALQLGASATHLDPSAQLTYAWDTDLDGTFDDGNGPTLSFTPVAPGPTLVGVQVTDVDGHADVAYATIAVAVSNHPPEITALEPAERAPFADVGEAVSFHVEATDADGDSLSFAWSVDDAPTGSDADFELTMPDEEPHKVAVVVSDTDPYSPDARVVSYVRAAKWEGEITGTGSGGAGSGGAGSGGDGNGSRANGGDGSGCGCDVPGGTRTPAGLGLLAAVVLGLARRRRR